jgi:hypothetical protein
MWFWQLPLTRAVNVALQVSDFFGQRRQLLFERVQAFSVDCTILLKVRGTTAGYRHDKPYPEKIHETENGARHPLWWGCLHVRVRTIKLLTRHASMHRCLCHR